MNKQITSVFAGEDTHTAVLMPEAVARVEAAIHAIQTLSGLMDARHEAGDWDDDAPPVGSNEAHGILAAISICAGSIRDFIDGGGMAHHYAVAIERTDAGFDQIGKLANEARDAQHTARDKRRMEILGKNNSNQTEGNNHA